MNQKHLRRLVEAMYAVPDFPALDNYGSRIFGRPVKGTWKLFRHITNTAVADIWQWSSDKELASYPKTDVANFEEFATLMLHEVTHGWCYFLKDDPSSRNYPTGIDEEQVCWDISRLVCEMLAISYQEGLAGLCYRAYLCMKNIDSDGLRRLLEKFPEHLRE